MKINAENGQSTDLTTAQDSDAEWERRLDKSRKKADKIALISANIGVFGAFIEAALSITDNKLYVLLTGIFGLYLFWYLVKLSKSI